MFNILVKFFISQVAIAYSTKATLTQTENCFDEKYSLKTMLTKPIVKVYTSAPLNISTTFLRESAFLVSNISSHTTLQLHFAIASEMIVG
ncbi:MAG: hypothetical protein ACJA1A_001826 [Saprospiraceae bacterium]|jgi:hypothetical protein